MELTQEEKVLYNFGKSMADLEGAFYTNILAICPTEADFEKFLKPFR